MEIKTTIRITNKDMIYLLNELIPLVESYYGNDSLENIFTYLKAFPNQVHYTYITEEVN